MEMGRAGDVLSRRFGLLAAVTPSGTVTLTPNTFRSIWVSLNRVKIL